MRVFLKLTLTVLPIAACGGPVDQQERGFRDGYAFGFSRDCEAAFANVDTELFEDAEYASGFARGRREGQVVCDLQRATAARPSGTQ